MKSRLRVAQATNDLLKISIGLGFGDAEWFLRALILKQ